MNLFPRCRYAQTVSLVGHRPGPTHCDLVGRTYRIFDGDVDVRECRANAFDKREKLGWPMNFFLRSGLSLGLIGNASAKIYAKFLRLTRGVFDEQASVVRHAD